MPKPFFIKKSDIDKIIRIDHAGELGANFIYKGQRKYIDKSYKELIHSMLIQELEHLEYFEYALRKFHVRPSFLFFFWSNFGYFIGALSSKLSVKSAMLLTEAIEDVIEEHYQKQKNFLQQAPQLYQELNSKISKFQQDESEHKHIATDFDINKSLLSKIFFILIQYVCQTSILLSKYI
ncbi:MAG: demethoxyubiquinone hydroxylase family protein [Rickettsia sp.]|nr:demethoxyubiquinone hydroxylase family protein [Rickettsia sp.]